MAHNTKVAADHAAPPVTRTLAEFVAAHPSGGWDAATENEAHRSVLNWLGCAIGASRHATIAAALAAVAGTRARTRRPVVLGRQRTRRHRRGGAPQRHQLAHVRLRRHASADDHPPGRAGRLVRAGAGRARWAQRPPIRSTPWSWHRRSLPRRQRDLSRPLRSRLAYHGIDGMLGAAAACARVALARRAARPRWRWVSRHRSRSVCASSSAP